MCAAPKGNEFWKLRSKHGRDKLFASPQLLWEAACEYFEWCQETPHIAVEQTKASPKAFKDENGDISFSPATVELPRMRPFTMTGLYLYLGCNTGYFSDFKIGIKEKTDKESKDFSEIIIRIEDIIYEQKFSGAASGFFNANIIARDLGLADKKEVVKTEYSGLLDQITPPDDI